MRDAAYRLTHKRLLAEDAAYRKRFRRLQLLIISGTILYVAAIAGTAFGLPREGWRSGWAPAIIIALGVIYVIHMGFLCSRLVAFSNERVQRQLDSEVSGISKSQ